MSPVDRLVDFPVPFGVEHDLGNARPVSKIDEHHHAVVATALHPPLQDHGLADMRLVQLSASMRSAFHVTLAFVSTTKALADVGSCSFSLVPIPHALPAAKE
jgi:hypothetical protein